MNAVPALTLLSCLGAAAFAVAGAFALRQGRLARGAAAATLSLLLLVSASLLAALAVSTYGYRALTREELAARVRVEPAADGSFRARFHFPDGAESSFALAGDELYVDAHILKWKPIANVLGLHTAYELDRVAGRYLAIEDERALPRTVFSLSRSKPLDLFELRRRFPLLGWLVDAEYGSASFVPAAGPASYEVRVSTSGLLIRRAPDDARAPGDRVRPRT